MKPRALKFMKLPQTSDQSFAALSRLWKSFEVENENQSSFFNNSRKIMQSFPRLLSGVARKDAAWVCSSCAKGGRRNQSIPLFQSSMTRTTSNTSKPRQNVAPTMEELRAPFKKRNASTMYYTFSIIMGTVALSYGSVPLYKMVNLSTPHHQQQC